MKILFVPIHKLNLPSNVKQILRSLKKFSFFKGGVAREALLVHFSRYDKKPKRALDYDFVVFTKDKRYNDEDDWKYGEWVPVADEEEMREYYRLEKIGDIEDSSDKIEYFKSRDNALNEVLLGRKGLYFTKGAKKSVCKMQIGLTSDRRPRVVLRNTLLSVRTNFQPPSAKNIKQALQNSSLIDQLIPLLKAYSLNIADQYYDVLADIDYEIFNYEDADNYFLSLLKIWKEEYNRDFRAKNPEDQRIIDMIKKRNPGFNSDFINSRDTIYSKIATRYLDKL
jgi:hypothetical protein